MKDDQFHFTLLNCTETFPNTLIISILTLFLFFVDVLLQCQDAQSQEREAKEDEEKSLSNGDVKVSLNFNAMEHELNGSTNGDTSKTVHQSPQKQIVSPI